jgi:glycosyltransferase involved in cell wall biosynthesis
MRHTEAYQGWNFDLVHGHDWMCAKAIVQVKNDLQRPAFLTIHSTEFGRAGNNVYDGDSARVRAVEAEGIYCADRVITVSGVLADEVKAQYHVPDWKLRTVHNGINCSKFDGNIDPAVCRASYGIGPMDPMVLYVGRLSLQKGPDLLLETVPQLLHNRGDAKVVFCGDGHMRHELEARADELGVAHAVRFLGTMHPDGDLINLFKSCDVVCVPSRNEPFGIVVLEAWAAGKPVVVSRNGGPSSFVGHDHDGFIVYPTPESIGWGLTSIFNSFDHARWMGERGRVKAAYSFSWDAVSESTEGVYGEIVQATLHMEEPSSTDETAVVEIVPSELDEPSNAGPQPARKPEATATESKDNPTVGKSTPPKKKATTPKTKKQTSSTKTTTGNNGSKKSVSNSKSSEAKPHKDVNRAATSSKKNSDTSAGAKDKGAESSLANNSENTAATTERTEAKTK